MTHIYCLLMRFALDFLRNDVNTYQYPCDGEYNEEGNGGRGKRTEVFFAGGAYADLIEPVER